MGYGPETVCLFRVKGTARPQIRNKETDLVPLLAVELTWYAALKAPRYEDVKENIQGF